LIEKLKHGINKTLAELFASHKLVRNIRNIRKIIVSKEGDGAFAVVDVDTLWGRLSDRRDFHWHGRACKIYTKMRNGKWKMIGHTGLLDYSQIKN
jgi:ketosteroid isomerase-like protein